MQGIRTILLTVQLCLCLTMWAQPADYTWTTFSKNSSESMPCGGGDIGLNVWVENGELLFYMCRSGAYDEYTTLLKQGRVRLRLDGQSMPEAGFQQTLKLQQGYQDIQLGGYTVRIWVDVYHPVVHLEVKGRKATTIDLSYESWRYADRPFRKGEARQGSLKWAKTTGLVTTKDSIRATESGVTFYHHNPAVTVFDRTVSIEGLDAVKDQLWNPVANLLSGGRLTGDNLTFTGTSKGEYSGTDYQAWNFRSAKPAKAHHVTIVFHTQQTADVNQWMAGLNQVEQSIRTERDRKATLAWWNQFWQRSYIEADGEAADLTRNFTLFRYMLGSNAYGTAPTKFNGGLFTFDPVHVQSKSNAPFTPDYRNWGGGTMTAQNQRLVYWPMLKNGDTDLMIPQFDAYNRMLSNAELRSRFYWNHAGGCFTEQMEYFGLPNMAEYGLKRPEWFDKGLEYNAWLEYTWDTVLEFCQMILESRRYAGSDIRPYTSFIESALTFFDEHYQFLASQRGIKKLDGEGKLILFPGSGCETYKMANNAASTVAALQTVLKSYVDTKLAMGDTSVGRWKEMLARIPDLPYRQTEGKKTIAPAKSWERVNNVETPQLYPVFPWRIFGVGCQGDSLQTARDTYNLDADAVKFRSSTGWKQDNIWAACLGMTDEAVRLTKEKLADGPHRFPAFWGPGFDWTPDHNWGGSGMIGLQEMLLQTRGGKIYLFPAWPATWNVRFKLHATDQTVVEAELRDGKVVSLQMTPESRKADVIINLKH